jgi:hypothetical protein
MSADIEPLRRRRQPPNALRTQRLSLGGFTPADARLAEVYRFWHEARRRHAGLPSRKDLDIGGHIDLFKSSLGWMNFVDVAPDDPANFAFLLFGGNISIFRCRDFTGVRLGDVPCPIYRGSVMADYQTVRAAGVPSLHAIKARLSGFATSYTRLLLPLARNGRDVDQLLAVMNKRATPELGELDPPPAGLTGHTPA